MRRGWAVAALAACVAGCGSPESSRLAAGGRVVVVAENGKYQWVEPVGRARELSVEHGATGIAVQDEEPAPDGSRRATVRFDGEPPWTGKILRRTLRPAE